MISKDELYWQERYKLEEQLANGELHCSGCNTLLDPEFEPVANWEIAPICKKCDEEWKYACKGKITIDKILGIYTGGKIETQVKYKFDKDADILEMIKDYRLDEFGYTTEVDKDLQAIADEYILNKFYKEDSNGVNFLNSSFTVPMFDSNVIVSCLLSDIKFNDFKELFKKTETIELLDVENLRVGISRDGDRTFILLASQLDPHTVLENRQRMNLAL